MSTPSEIHRSYAASGGYDESPQPLLWMWFLFVAGTFWLADGFSLSLGDDFGYMFTDSYNHAGDGHRVTSFADVIGTQAQQYVTTNGRFVVHVAVMSMLNLVPEWLYRLANALIFGLLWFSTLRLGFRKADGWFASTVVLCWIWWLIPDAGTVMLSLVSYSVNYMWTGAAILGLLIASRNASSMPCGWFAALCIYALFCGSLQESFSLPLAAALAIDTVASYRRLSRRKITLRIFFLVGSSVVIFAPGNLVHFSSGGAFGAASLLHKALSMLEALSLSAISVLAVVMIVWAIVSRKGCKAFIVSNRILFMAIVVAILFASFTFTASRQLFAPSLFAIILLCRILHLKAHSLRRLTTPATVILLVVWIAMYVGIIMQRRDVYNSYFRFYESASASKQKIMEGDASLSPYNTHPTLWKFFGNYAPDPWERSHFGLSFDSYSRHGLSRLIFGDDKKSVVGAILPYPADYLVAICPLQPENASETYPTSPVDSRYRGVAVAAAPPRKVSTDAPNRRQFEQFFTSDGITFVLVPEYVRTVKFIYD